MGDMILRTARTKKLCTSCGGEISKGERYWRENPDYNEDGDDISDERKEHISCPIEKFTAGADLSN